MKERDRGDLAFQSGQKEGAAKNNNRGMQRKRKRGTPAKDDLG